MSLNLYLIRHSVPAIHPGIPACQWNLSPTGHQRAAALADRLADTGLRAVISSREPKAMQTAQPIAARHSLEVVIGEGLHEHARSRVEYSSQAVFAAAVQGLFDQPAILVFGDETADQAYRRFAAAVDEAILHHSGISLAIVAHGTVISLLVSRRCGLAPFSIWKQLGLPAYFVIRLPDFSLLETHFNPIP